MNIGCEESCGVSFCLKREKRNHMYESYAPEINQPSVMSVSETKVCDATGVCLVFQDFRERSCENAATLGRLVLT